MKLEYNKDSNIGITPFGYEPTSKLIITKYIMTPKEKAKQLIYAFEAFTDRENELEFAKQCALIAVDEIVEQLKEFGWYKPQMTYWDAVKQEIEKL